MMFHVLLPFQMQTIQLFMHVTQKNACGPAKPRFLPAPGPPAAAKAKMPLPPTPKTPAALTAPPAAATPPAEGGGFF